MAESGTRATLASDLRKMAPVWGIVVATAIIVAFSMKYIGRTQLRRAALGNGSACDYAEVYLSGARARMSGRRDVAARLRYEKRELDKPSLGLLKDDDILIGVKNDLERASALCPTNSEADWTLAVADWYLGDQCAALYHLGTAERRSGRLPEALIQHSLALEVCPDDVPNLLGKAACLRELNRIDEAVALVHEHGDQLTAAPEGKLIVGRVLSQTTETLTAEKLLAEGLVSNPADVHAVMDYVKVMKDSDRPEEGADFLMALGRQDVPTIAQVYHIAAITYREQKKLPKEENALRDALKLFPNSAALCYDLSVNLYIQGKKAEAREMAKRAIDYDVNVLQQIKDNGLDPAVLMSYFPARGQREMGTMEDESPASAMGPMAKKYYGLLAAAALIASIPSLMMGLHADDWFQVRPRSFAQVFATFAGDWNEGAIHAGGFYRPLVRLSFFLDELIHHSSSAGCHLTNSLLFAGCVLLVGSLARSFCGGHSREAAIAITLILVLSPLKNEALLWVSGRTDLLASLFVLAALRSALASLRTGSWYHTAAALCLLVAALMSKEIAIAGCVLIPLAMLFFAHGEIANSPRKRILVIAPIIVGFGYFAFRSARLGGLAGYGRDQPIEISEIARNIATIMSGIFCPWQAAGSVFHPRMAILAALVCPALLALSAFRRGPLFCLIACVVAALPMATITISPLDGSRVLFLPLTFFCLFLVTVFCQTNIPTALPRVFLLFACIIALSLQWANGSTMLAMIRSRRASDRAVSQVSAFINSAPTGAQVVIPEGKSNGGPRILAPGAAMQMAAQTCWLRTPGNSSENLTESKPPRAAITLRGKKGEVFITPNLQPWMRKAVTVLTIKPDGSVSPVALEFREETILHTPIIEESRFPLMAGGRPAVYSVEETRPAGGPEPIPAAILKGQSTGSLPVLDLKLGSVNVAWGDTIAAIGEIGELSINTPSNPIHPSFPLRSLKITSYGLKVTD